MAKDQKNNQVAKITEEMLVEYREAFDLFDITGTQKISTTDVTLLMRKLGLMPTNAEVEEMLNEIDKDGTIAYEGMTFEQFCQLAARKVPDVYTSHDIIEAFRVFDIDGNGFLAANDLRQALCNLGEQLSPEEMDAMLETANPDQDGNIYYQDFIKNIMSEN